MTGRHNRPALHVAAEVGNVQIAALLLDYGADIEEPESALFAAMRDEKRGGNQAWSAMTPLDWAKHHEQHEMAAFCWSAAPLP